MAAIFQDGHELNAFDFIKLDLIGRNRQCLCQNLCFEDAEVSYECSIIRAYHCVIIMHVM